MGLYFFGDEVELLLNDENEEEGNENNIHNLVNKRIGLQIAINNNISFSIYKKDK